MPIEDRYTQRDMPEMIFSKNSVSRQCTNSSSKDSIGRRAPFQKKKKINYLDDNSFILSSTPSPLFLSIIGLSGLVLICLYRFPISLIDQIYGLGII
jgi:hypothetical protein